MICIKCCICSETIAKSTSCVLAGFVTKQTALSITRHVHLLRLCDADDSVTIFSPLGAVVDLADLHNLCSDSRQHFVDSRKLQAFQ